MSGIPVPMRMVARNAAVALLTVVIGCDSATAPRASSLDAKRAMEDYRAFEAVFGGDSWRGLQALSGRTPGSASGIVRSARNITQVTDSKHFTVSLMRDLITARTDFAKTIVSTRHLGRTMVYDSALDRYVIDASRTGAPQNGVRFVVYEVDALGHPIPTQEIGYADLLDEGASTGEALALRLIAVTRGVTTLDYRTRVEMIGQGGKVDVSGFAVEGTSRLQFRVGVAAEIVNGRTLIDADFDISLAPRNFEVEGSVRDVVEGQEGEGDITLVVRHQENVVNVQMKGNAGVLDGTILVNGKLFVTVTGEAAQPTLRGATGQPLSGSELLVFMRIIDVADDIFDLVEDLVRPVDNLIVLGWVL